MLEAGLFSSVAPLMGGVIEENIVRKIIAFLDERQANGWMVIGVAVSCMGLIRLPQLHGIISVIVGFLIAVIGNERGKY